MDPNATTSAASPAKGPKKYIRTFAGDLETLKKGGPPPPPPQPFIPPAPKKPEITPLETYEGDFLAQVKETRASTVAVLAAEQDAEASAPAGILPPRTSRRSIIYGIAGGVLILAGAGGAYLAYIKYLSASSPIPATPAPSAPIFVDEREQVSGAGLTLIKAIQQSAARPLTQGNIRLLSLENAANATVFSGLRLSAPGVVLRNIVPALSMAGIVKVGPEQSPFFILSVSSFGNTFAGMLSWETVMPRDFIRLYPPRQAAVPSATATSTAATSTAPAIPIVPAAAPAFRDETAANHDVRVYRDAEGRSILLYGYWNQTTLVIARDPYAFAEIVSRLATSRAQ